MKTGKMMINYWPSFMLSLALMAGIVACLRQLDCLMIQEMRAMISILFGFAVSCFILSFIWLLQRKTVARTWSDASLSTGDEVPSMHPEGRDISNESNQSVINTVSSSDIDIPPAYEEALINSKPIILNGDQADIKIVGQLDFHCSCPKRRWFERSETTTTTTKLECVCSSKLLYANGNKRSTMKAIDTTGHNSNYNRCTMTSSSGYSSSSSSSRKVSFVQLDVDQLLVTSPPKYHELHFGDSEKVEINNYSSR